MFLGSPQNVKEISTRCYFLGVKAENLPPSCVQFLEILGDSTSWNSQGLSSALMGLFY